MSKATQAYRLNRLMYKEINEMCARYEEECGEVISHYETEQERELRLKKKFYEELRKRRWTLHENREVKSDDA